MSVGEKLFIRMADLTVTASNSLIQSLRISSEEPQVVFTVNWRCLRCSQKGRFDRPGAETVDVTWNRVVEAHAIASPECERALFSLAEERREGNE